MRRSRESRSCTPITAPTTPACWRSTVSSASKRARWSSSWRRRSRRPPRPEIRGSAQAAAIIGCGMSVVARPGDSGLAMQTDGFAIVVEGLRKRYGSLVAVDGISFRVKEREIFGLLGPNGAGKTTTVEILEGLRSADDGQALVGGIDVRRDPQKVKNVIGVQLQSSAFFDGLNLLERAQSIRAEGRTIVLTTHYMDEAQTLCDRVAIMDHGKILAMEPPDAR